MKNFLSVALIFFTLFLVGCGEERNVAEKLDENKNVGLSTNKVEQPAPEPEKVDAILVAGSFWVIESENMMYLKDAIARSDMEYLKQLTLEGKVYLVDKDTKVTRFGVAADENNVLISFKEGRYTNKSGYTFANNVFAEKEYPAAYLAIQNEEPITLIHHGLASTANYFELIEAKNTESLNQMLNLCETIGKKMRENAEDAQLNSAVRECLQASRKIVLSRGAAIFGYLDFVKAQSKRDREITLEATYELCKDEITLRKIFRDKYGF